MGILLQESFDNASGYDNADWTEVIGSGSTVNENSTGVSDSQGGSTEILLVDKVSPNFNAMTRHEISASPIVYFTGWVYISSYTLPSAGNNVNLFELLDASQASKFAVVLRKTSDAGNPVVFRAFLETTGVGDYPSGGTSISTGQWYKIRFKFDRTNSLYEFYVDSTLVASSSWSPAGTDVTRIKVGDNDNGMQFQGYFDELYLGSDQYYPVAETGVNAVKYYTGADWARGKVWVYVGGTWVHKPFYLRGASDWEDVEDLG